MISILIPTYNNLTYLKLCINSLIKNSYYNNEILLHINEGTDGTIEYANLNNLKYSYSKINDGLCIGINKISKKTRFEYLLYSHDDMYFCPNWDKILMDEVNNLGHNNFYLSSIMINGDPKLKGHLNFDAGDTVEKFNESKLLKNFNKLRHHDFQGSTWAPHLIHKDLWNKVGGFSEEFSPGAGSDPDLNMKLWNKGIRIFKCLGNSKVYHFGSITIRKKNSTNFKKNLGSRASKIFLRKWGITINFFKKHYLKSDCVSAISLQNPKKNMAYFFDLIKVKILYLYVILVRF
jgi:glycosyltransferase involved in cell wall biosynthesis